MKDESFLDSAGPIFIISALAAVMVLVTFLMVRGNGDWGDVTHHAALARDTHVAFH